MHRVLLPLGRAEEPLHAVLLRFEQCTELPQGVLLRLLKIVGQQGDMFCQSNDGLVDLGQLLYQVGHTTDQVGAVGAGGAIRDLLNVLDDFAESFFDGLEVFNILDVALGNLLDTGEARCRVGEPLPPARWRPQRRGLSGVTALHW